MTSCGLQVVMDLAFVPCAACASVNGSRKCAEELSLSKRKALNDSISSESVISMSKAPHLMQLAGDQAL